MLEIKFLNENKKEINLFKRVDDNVVCVGMETENTKGFYTYLNGKKVGDFADYRTIYKREDGKTYFSNDGSIYVEPNKIVHIHAYFSGEVDETHIVPNSVVVGTNFGDYVLTKENDYACEIIIPASQEIEITNATDVDGFEKEIAKENVYYTSNAPTWKERVDAQVLFTALMTDTLIEGYE